MQKPNVLFISSWYPSKEHPTLGNFVQRHAEAINPFVNLYVVYVVSSNYLSSNYVVENTMIDKVNTTVVYYKKVINSNFGLGSLFKLFRYKKAYQKGIEFVEEKFNINKWKLTHCNVTFPAGLVALQLKKKRNIPYVLTEHWTLFLPYRNDYKELKGIIKNKMKSVVKNAEFTLPVSLHLKAAMQEKGFDGNYKVIPNVVDTELFKPIEKNNKEVKQILHVSTLDDNHKNYSGIFRVLKKIGEKRTDFKLVIVSDGDVEQAVKIQNEIGLEKKFVEFHGTKTPLEIAKYYQESDFFLLFSNYENLPVVISESLCCGLPVISSNVGGIPEMITKENGILIEPRDEKGLENSIQLMLDNVQDYKRNTIRKSAIKTYDKEVVGQMYLEVYSKII